MARYIGHALGDHSLTVPTATFAGAEFPVMRCDYVLATAAMATSATRYEVTRTPWADAASDHYPNVATFQVTT